MSTTEPSYEPASTRIGYTAGQCLALIVAGFGASLVSFTLGIWAWNIAVAITRGPHV